MKSLFVLAPALMLLGCGSSEEPRSEATYPAIEEDGAPTVADLQARGYIEVDRNAVGCVIPGEPETACDGFDAIFLDEAGKFGEHDVAVAREEYDRYAFVCPAMDVELSQWKCRGQERTDG